MANELIFTQDGNKYICELTPTSPMTIQIERDKKSDLSVYAFLDNMTPVPLFSSNLIEDVIFQIDVPNGVKVKIVSWGKVLEAKYI